MTIFLPKPRTQAQYPILDTTPSTSISSYPNLISSTATMPAPTLPEPSSRWGFLFCLIMIIVVLALLFAIERAREHLSRRNWLKSELSKTDWPEREIWLEKELAKTDWLDWTKIFDNEWAFKTQARNERKKWLQSELAKTDWPERKNWLKAELRKMDSQSSLWIKIDWVKGYWTTTYWMSIEWMKKIGMKANTTQPADIDNDDWPSWGQEDGERDDEFWGTFINAKRPTAPPTPLFAVPEVRSTDNGASDNSWNTSEEDTKQRKGPMLLLAAHIASVPTKVENLGRRTEIEKPTEDKSRGKEKLIYDEAVKRWVMAREEDIDGESEERIGESGTGRVRVEVRISHEDAELKSAVESNGGVHSVYSEVERLVGNEGWGNDDESE
ncbi:uncharacterized protein PAC_11338 [Phialocephala subalpina]|uniref:Uncharacterized protein n=1 Tax=Phialocephala subalpina TaxID=576137 RepID=A0A1L7X8V3_9HELO|nr:uncharacterized protein PAC_11338 [Phialocephala subalpina]